MEALTHEYSLRVLLSLLREDRNMTVDEIADEIGKPSGSVVHAIDILEEAKLVDCRTRHDAPYYREVSLTMNGWKVAERLREIEKIIGWMSSEGIP